MSKKRKYFIAGMVAIAVLMIQLILQSAMRPYAKDNFYFQGWTSEKMMQTVSLQYLKSDPVETLNNIHINPPGFAAIRAFFVHLWTGPDILVSLSHVDFLLSQLWTVLYSLMGAIIFLWLSELTNSKIAFPATFALLLHPAFFLYTTLLDNNFLTIFLVFIFFYILWRIKKQKYTSIVAIIIITLALFFTRVIFQIPFLIVVAISLFLLKIPKRNILIYLLIVGSITGLYNLKQYYKFGIFSGSSFAGLNLNRSVGNPNFINYWELDMKLDEPENSASLAQTLTHPKKVKGFPNYNHIQYLKYNQELLQVYKEYMLTTPISKILLSYWRNLKFYFMPSSKYHTKHAIVDHLPWRFFYDTLFSAPILPVLLIVLGVSWLATSVKQQKYLEDAGFLLPGLYIFLVTVLFEKGENMRFKFFLEPLFIIFFTSQLYTIGQKLKRLSEIRFPTANHRQSS